MRSAFFALLCALTGFAALLTGSNAAQAGAAGALALSAKAAAGSHGIVTLAGGSYKCRRSCGSPPRYRRRARRYYPPRVVYVRPPPVRYYPRPVYRRDCRTGGIYGPAGTYYPRRGPYIGW